LRCENLQACAVHPLTGILIPSRRHARLLILPFARNLDRTSCNCHVAPLRSSPRIRAAPRSGDS
jgi:hypothetical protein